MKNFIKKYGWPIYMVILLGGFSYFMITVVGPDFSKAQSETIDLYYGKDTFNAWVKLNKGEGISHGEWYRLVRAGYINKD